MIFRLILPAMLILSITACNKQDDEINFLSQDVSPFNRLIEKERLNGKQWTENPYRIAAFFWGRRIIQKATPILLMSNRKSPTIHCG